ncbi:helix-turn-helix domain-containing protein [Actinoplanes sp. NPDC051851]|uniref:TetR/AcrR family transcriptional regulator n=1 Tax=Actinoplanes sp. NPDC051851 TaxID=3154753 RepID=UPI00343326D1
MANLRAVQKQMTRRLLLDHALALFQERGYAATTIDEIAAAAGTTRTTFYLHFPSKAQLMRALMTDVETILGDSVECPLADVIADGDPGAIERWLTTKADQWSTIRAHLTAAYQAAAIDPEINNALESWSDETISALLKGLERAGRFDPSTRQMRCVLAFGQFEYLARRWLRSGWPSDRDTAMRALTASWCHLLLTER